MQVVQHHSFNSNIVHPVSFDSDEDIRHPLEPRISIDYLSTSPLEQSYQEHDLVNLKSKVISVQVKDDDDKGAEVRAGQSVINCNQPKIHFY